MISPAPNTCRLNIQPLGQFPPAPRLSVSLIHIAQQCGPLATHRRICNLANTDLTFHTCAAASLVLICSAINGCHCGAGSALCSTAQ